jgi:exodeoxyribonuclease-3
MRIISYNVNGIRAAISKGFLNWLQQADPDIICLQEIKATEDQIPLLDVELSGYPYHYWFPATKKGYSGVAILSKVKPNKVVFGTGIDHMDFEGRNLRIDFDDFSVMSLYLPSGTNFERLDYKFQYMDEFQEYVDNLKK